MQWWLAMALVVLGAFLLDMGLLWAERRGWIFYRKRKPTGGGSAMLGVAAELFQPGQHSAVQELEEQSRKSDEAESEGPEDRELSRLTPPDNEEQRQVGRS